MTANYVDHPDNLDVAAIIALNRLYDAILPPLGTRILDDLLAKACYLGAAFSGRKGFMVVFDQMADLDTIHFRCLKAKYDRFLYLERIAVHPTCQRTGIARNLLDDLTEFAVSEGHTHIGCSVTTRPPDWAAHRLFASSGFGTVSETKSEDGSLLETDLLCVLPPASLVQDLNTRR